MIERFCEAPREQACCAGEGGGGSWDMLPRKVLKNYAV